MKNLPEKISMQAEMFMDGAHGYRCQVYVNREFRVHCVSEKLSHSVPFVRSWSIDSLQGKSFQSYEELRKAMGKEKAEK